MLYCQNLLEDLKVDLITESKNKVFIIHAAFEEHRLAAVVPRNCWIGDGFRTVGKRNGTVVVGEDALANLEFAWSQTNSVDENWFESSDFCTANMEGVEGIRSTSMDDFAVYNGLVYVVAFCGWDLASQEDAKKVWDYLLGNYEKVKDVISARRRGLLSR
jgi:hypothetical protein